MKYSKMFVCLLSLCSTANAEYAPDFSIVATLAWQDPWGGTQPVATDAVWMPSLTAGPGIFYDAATGNRRQRRSMGCLDSTRDIPNRSGPLDPSFLGFNATPQGAQITDCSDISGQDRSGYGARTSTPWAAPFTSAVSTRAAFTNLSGASFEHVNLDHSLFTEANLSDARFWGSHLLSVDLNKANAVRADFSYSRVSPVYAIPSDPYRDPSGTITDFTGAKFDFAYLAMRAQNSKFDGASFRNTQSHFGAGESPPITSYLRAFNSSFESADFSHSRISSLRFERSNLKSARFDHAAFGTLSFHESTLDGTSFLDTNLRNTYFMQSRVKSNLSASDLRGSLFSESDLRESTFSQSPAIFACGAIRHSDFRQTNIDRAQLKCAAIEIQSISRDGVITESKFEPGLQITPGASADFYIRNTRESWIGVGRLASRTTAETNWSRIPDAVKQECRLICGPNHPVWGNPNPTDDQVRYGSGNVFNVTGWTQSW